jgi:hypothetical protein
MAYIAMAKEGIWPLHDHTEKAVSIEGANSGGDIIAIVYKSFLSENGIPLAKGVDVSPYLSKEFYQGKTGMGYLWSR